MFENEPGVPVNWGTGAESVRQEGRSVSILASRNVDELMGQARAIPGAKVEQYPVGLKEIFMEHVRVN